MILAKSLEKDVSRDALSRACDVEDGLSNDFEKSRVSERVETTSRLGVCEKKRRAYCLVRSSVLTTAASKELWERKEGE